MLGSPRATRLRCVRSHCLEMVSTVWGAALLLVLFLAPVLLTFRLPTRGAVCRGISAARSDRPLPRSLKDAGTAIASSRTSPGSSPNWGSTCLPMRWARISCRGAACSPAPTGSGFQLSLYGIFCILLAAREGLEVNLLGLGLGADPVRPALKLPALGRLVMENL